MPFWNTKRFAAHTLVLGLAGLCCGFQAGCHKHSDDTDYFDPPVVQYQTTAILATAGQPYSSVTPQVSAYSFVDDAATTQTTGFSFAVTPALPGGLVLNPSTGQITGTPAAVDAPASYLISASNAYGSGYFAVSVGVQASSPVAMDYAGTGAVSTAVNASIALPAGAVTGGTPAGFGVSPALPAGLVVNAQNGLVSGRPTAAIPLTTFTLTVTTPAGSANAPFLLQVTAAKPAAPGPLTYPGIADLVALTQGQAVGASIPAPTVTGSDLLFTVTPALPAGLTFDPLTGIIAGTPAAAAAQAAYTVTAANGGGNAQAVVNLTVN
jgi:hypothetical protein